LRPALLTWARWPEILGHISLPGATADVPHLRFSLSELGLSELSPSLSLQGRERRGRRRKKRRSRGGDGEVKEGGYKYARRRTDETSADRGTELGRQGEVSAPFQLCACGCPTLDRSPVKLSAFPFLQSSD